MSLKPPGVQAVRLYQGQAALESWFCVTWFQSPGEQACRCPKLFTWQNSCVQTKAKDNAETLQKLLHR